MLIDLVASNAEGCDTGFWKNKKHYEFWSGFSTEDSFDAVFGVQSSFGGTLLDVVDQKGGGEKAMAREAVAALLNASSLEVNASYSSTQIIQLTQQSYSSGDFKPTERALKDGNKESCPLK